MSYTLICQNCGTEVARTPNKICIKCKAPNWGYTNAAPSYNPTKSQNTYHSIKNSYVGSEKINNCQFCEGEISETAQVCKHCGREQVSKTTLQEYAENIAREEIRNYELVKVFQTLSPFIFLFGVFLFFANFFIAIIYTSILIVILFVINSYIQRVKNEIIERDTVLDIVNHNALVHKRVSLRKQRGVIFLISSATLLFIIILFTNPSEKDFERFTEKENINLFSRIESKDYYLFSFFAYKSNQYLSSKTDVYIGILGQFYKLQ